MTSLIKAKIQDSQLLTRALLEGNRWTGELALEDHLVQDIVPKDQLITKGLEYARRLKEKKHAGPVYHEIKENLYKETIKLQLKSKL